MLPRPILWLVFAGCALLFTAYGCGSADGDDLFTGSAAAGGSSGSGSGATTSSGGRPGTGTPSPAIGSTRCGQDTCGEDAFCCVLDNQNPSCRDDANDCPGSRVDCDGPEDCPLNLRCCGSEMPSQDGKTYLRTDCRERCDGDAFSVCGDRDDACPPGSNCEDSEITPAYRVCR